MSGTIGPPSQRPQRRVHPHRLRLQLNPRNRSPESRFTGSRFKILAPIILPGPTFSQPLTTDMMESPAPEGVPNAMAVTRNHALRHSQIPYNNNPVIHQKISSPEQQHRTEAKHQIPGRKSSSSSSRLSSVSAVPSSSDLGHHVQPGINTKQHKAQSKPFCQNARKPPINRQRQIVTRKTDSATPTQPNSTFFTRTRLRKAHDQRRITDNNQTKRIPALIAADPSKAAVVDTRISGSVVPILSQS